MGFSLEQLALEQFEALDHTTRLVIIHPNYIQQHLLLGSLLRAGTSVYVRFEGQDLTHTDLRQQLEAARTEQTTAADTVEQMILDEADRGTPADLDAFLRDLVVTETNTRVIVLGRSIPQIVLDDETIRPLTRFVPFDEQLMLWDYAHPTHEPDTHLLEVRSLGTGHVLLNGHAIQQWDGVLPRSLFFFLVDRGMTTRNDIFETFWRNLTAREATNVFHVTKRKISEVLSVDLTVYFSGFYRVAPHIYLSYDALQFFEIVQNSAVMTAENAIPQLERALLLYRAAFLTSVDMDWVEHRREELVQSYEEALVMLARALEEVGENERALGLYLRATRANPQREDIVYNIMQLYQQMEMPDDAALAYDRLKADLQAQLAVEPSGQLRELYAELTGKQPVLTENSAD